MRCRTSVTHESPQNVLMSHNQKENLPHVRTAKGMFVISISSQQPQVESGPDERPPLQTPRGDATVNDTLGGLRVPSLQKCSTCSVFPVTSACMQRQQMSSASQ